MEEKKLTETMENTAYETTSEPIFSDCESVKKTEKFPITKRDLIFAFLFLVSAFVFFGPCCKRRIFLPVYFNSFRRSTSGEPHFLPGFCVPAAGDVVHHS